MLMKRFVNIQSSQFKSLKILEIFRLETLFMNRLWGNMYVMCSIPNSSERDIFKDMTGWVVTLGPGVEKVWMWSAADDKWGKRNLIEMDEMQRKCCDVSHLSSCCVLLRFIFLCLVVLGSAGWRLKYATNQSIGSQAEPVEQESKW